MEVSLWLPRYIVIREDIPALHSGAIGNADSAAGTGKAIHLNGYLHFRGFFVFASVIGGASATSPSRTGHARSKTLLELKFMKPSLVWKFMEIIGKTTNSVPCQYNPETTL
jgi:hypothetical protein